MQSKVAGVEPSKKFHSKRNPKKKHCCLWDESFISLTMRAAAAVAFLSLSCVTGEDIADISDPVEEDEQAAGVAGQVLCFGEDEFDEYCRYGSWVALV